MADDNYIKNKTEHKTKYDLIMTAWQNIVEKQSQEMRRGYFNTKSDKFGNVNVQWVPDTRDQYFQAIISLRDLLTIDELGDDLEKLKTAEEKLNTDAEKLFNKYGYKEFIVVSTKLINTYSSYKYTKKYTGNITMPEVSRKPNKYGFYSIAYDLNVTTGTITIPVSWDSKHHQYKESLINIYTEFYRTIVELLAHNSFSSGGGSGDSE